MVEPTWNDVAGLEEAKHLLSSVIRPSNASDPAGRRILLYGPSGCGKTYLTRALVSELGLAETSKNVYWPVQLLNRYYLMHSVPDMYTLITPRNLQDVFRDAASTNPPLLIIHDLHKPYSDQSTDPFLKQVAELAQREAKLHIIATTSVPWDIEALIPASVVSVLPSFWEMNYPHRFDTLMYIPLPNLKARRRLIVMRLSTSSQMALSAADVAFLAQRTEGYTSLDIEYIIRDAQSHVVRALLDATHFRPVHADGMRKWAPCAPSEPGAVVMTWDELRDDELADEDIRLADFLEVLENRTPSAYTECEEWAARRGIS